MENTIDLFRMWSRRQSGNVIYNQISINPKTLERIEHMVDRKPPMDASLKTVLGIKLIESTVVKENEVIMIGYNPATGKRSIVVFQFGESDDG